MGAKAWFGAGLIAASGCATPAAAPPPSPPPPAATTERVVRFDAGLSAVPLANVAQIVENMTGVSTRFPAPPRGFVSTLPGEKLKLTVSQLLTVWRGTLQALGYDVSSSKSDEMEASAHEGAPGSERVVWHQQGDSVQVTPEPPSK